MRYNNAIVIKYSFMLLKVLIILFFLFSFSPIEATSALKLTTEEIKKIKKFSENIPIEQGVGQFFMINLPIDYADSFNRRNFNDRKDKKDRKYKLPIHKVLIEEGFGSILLQSSNFKFLNRVAETEEERIGLITAFVNNLQYRAISKKNKGVKIPLFIAVDFEGPSVNSIKNTLITPPPALTLAISRNMDFIEKTGKIVGYQLNNSGINMILGPVLDIEKTKQETYNTILLNRSFSSYADNVIKAASYYIKGLRQSGMTVIGKHFPGLGGVTGNPHKKPVYFENKTSFQEHLKPYRELRPKLDGIMTSHVSLSFLKNRDKKPATCNKSIIQFIRGKPFPEEQKLKTLNYKDELILTDDLGMKGISHCDKKINYAKIAIKAIEAGHNIVMFAKVLANREKYKSGGIYIKDLIKVKEKLEKYFNNNRKKYKDSLYRIIQAKAISYKRNGGSIDNFISEDINKVIRNQLPVPDLVKGNDGFLDLQKMKDFYEEIIEKSYLVLKSGYSYSIENANSICIFTPKEHKNDYSDLTSLYEDKLHISHNMHEDIKSLSEKIKNIKHYITDNSCDIIFSVINNQESIDRIMNIINFLKETKNNTTHLVLLLHQTPISLRKDITNNKKITIMGSFTEHKISYKTDIKIIKGDIEPKNIKQLTIDYNNEIFNRPLEDTVNKKLEKEKKEIEIKRIKEKKEKEQAEQKQKREREKQAKEKREKEKKEIELVKKEVLECKEKMIKEKDFNNRLHKNVFLISVLILFLFVFAIVYLLRKNKKNNKD